MTDLENKIYDGCKEIYDHCYDIIETMSTCIKTFMDSKGVTDYNPEVTLIKFDVLLQYSLLQIATADYDIDKNEIVFIRGLTKKGDLVNYINANSSGGTPITWDMIYRADVLDVRKALDLLKSEIVKLSKEFVMVFSTCDLATPEYDFFSDLVDGVFCIIKGLASMDGKIECSEADADCLILDTLEEIKKIKCQ